MNLRIWKPKKAEDERRWASKGWAFVYRRADEDRRAVVCKAHACDRKQGQEHFFMKLETSKNLAVLAGL